MPEIDTTIFLSNFLGYCVQTFDDKGRNGALAACFRPDDKCWNRLSKLNKQGAGVFFTPNSFPNGIRQKVECTGVNAWFFEIDDRSFEEQWEIIETAPVQPSIIVKAKKSLHCYYIAENGSIDNFETIQKGLIAYFGADKACKDITRVLRIPGYFHNKGEPHMVEIVKYEPVKVYEAVMMESFPVPVEEPVKKDTTIHRDGGFWNIVSSFDNKMMLQRLSGTAMVNDEVYSFRSRSSGGEYIDVDGQIADAWLDEQGKVGSNKKGGPTYIQWLEYYGWSKADIAEWLKEECKDLLSKKLVKGDEVTAGKETQADRLLNLFYEQKPVLFTDQMGDSYVVVEIDGKKVILKCESNKFEKYLLKLFWDKAGGFIANDGVSKVLRLISAKAEHEGEQLHLYNRVALHENDFWYDLGDFKAVRCGFGKWCIVDDVPVLFKSQQHQKAQDLPIGAGGDLMKFFNHVSIKDTDQKLLFVVWLVAAFVPDIPHPILVLFGEKGASKSTTLRFARSVIDPSRTGLLSLPSKEELIQQLSHNYAPCYDNITRLNEGVSDVLCRAVTGEGGSKRRLYTDDEDMLYSFRRVIGINGINNVVQKSDLLDRSILIELSRITKGDRKTEAMVNHAFEIDKPIILAGLFDVLAKARVIIVDLEMKEYPRMADFAKWGCAIAEAMSFGSDEFLRVYSDNIGKQNQEVIENDPVAQVLTVFMEDRPEWEGSPTELFEKLEEIAEKIKIDKKHRPKSPSALGRQIKMVQSNLEESGILFESLKDCRGHRGRFYYLSRNAVASDSSVESPCLTGADSDGGDTSDVTYGVEDFLAKKCVLGKLSPDDQVRAVEEIMCKP